MDLIGQVVRHKSFGKGKITEFENNHITVLFDDVEGKKIFQYPFSFGKFLEIENKSFNNKIEVDTQVEVKKQVEEKEAEKKRFEYMIENKKKTTLTRSKNKKDNQGNIVFKCNYCDGGESSQVIGYKGICSDKTIEYNIKKSKSNKCRSENSNCLKYLNGKISREELLDLSASSLVCSESCMLNDWKVYLGTVQSGKRKGQPIEVKNIDKDSLALLSTKSPNTKEDERFVFAAFLIDQKNCSDDEEEGYVVANSKYKIMLSPEESKKVKFWDFYFNPKNPEKIILGSGQHRYISDIQAAQVLREIYNIKKETDDEKSAKDLFEHYCDLKHIDIKDLPEQNGGLRRK